MMAAGKPDKTVDGLHYDEFIIQNVRTLLIYIYVYTDSIEQLYFYLAWPKKLFNLVNVEANLACTHNLKRMLKMLN